MKRRNFIKAGAIGSSLLATFPYQAFAGDKKKYIYDRVKLGNTGIELSRMAMGTGTNGGNNSSNQTRQLGIKGLPDLLHAAYDEGVNFWDSADMYGSHDHLNKALRHVPREKVVILTKSTTRNAKGMKEDIERFRKEIDTDYLDIVLLHAVTDGNWRKNLRGAMDVLSEYKEKGTIKALGISCHSLEALKAAAEEPWVEVDLARFNPAGVAMDADVETVRTVLQKMKKNGKAIIGMKVYGAGKLINKKDECLEFQTGHDFIDTFTLGIENYDQFVDINKRLPAASVRG